MSLDTDKSGLGLDDIQFRTYHSALEIMSVEEKAMENEETISEIDINSQNLNPKTSKLAVMSMVFGILGPFYCGLMWIVSFNDFLKIGNGFIMAAFFCGLAWILGLASGAKSFKQVKNSEGQLVGKEYAIAGIIISAAWMALIFVGLLLPALYYVNS